MMFAWFLRFIPLGVRGFVTRYAAIIIIGGVLAAVGVVFWQGYRLGKASAENKSMTKVIDIREKQNEIRNNRPDTRGLVIRLREGSF